MTFRKLFTLSLAALLLAALLVRLVTPLPVAAAPAQQDFPEPPAGFDPSSLPADFDPSNLPEGFRENLAEGASALAEASSTISALGSVESGTVVSLSFQSSGKVSALYVKVGDYVEAGEVLADLDSTDAWNTYQEALLRLESAQLAYDDLLAPPTETEIDLAEASIASAQASYSSVANGTSESQLQQSELRYQQLQTQLNSLQVQRANMNGSEEEIALQEARIGAATFNLEIARLELEQSQTPNSSSLWSASLRVQQAQLELEQLLAGPTEQQVTNAQLAVERAQSAVLSAQTALEQSQLVSPRSGYVTAVSIAAGDTASAASAALEIADLSHLQMTVPVNELDIGRVLEGQAATIQLDALTGVEFPGVVQSVGWLSETSTDGIVTYAVQVRLETTDSRVRLGMTGEVVLDTETSAS